MLTTHRTTFNQEELANSNDITTPFNTPGPSEPDVENNCPICFDDLTDIIIFECDHTICIQCLQKIYSSQGPCKKILCPICRNVIENRSQSKSQDALLSDQSPTSPTSHDDYIYDAHESHAHESHAHESHAHESHAHEPRVREPRVRTREPTCLIHLYYTVVCFCFTGICYIIALSIKYEIEDSHKAS